MFRNGEISVIESPVIETTGTNEFNFMISGFDTGNSFSKKNFNELSNQHMKSYNGQNGWENTYKILGTNCRGQFVHPESDNGGSDQCLMLCQESNFKLEQEIPKMLNMNSNVIDIPIDKKIMVLEMVE